ncbi:MAG: hypothetical protein ABR928_20770, partial [Terracidiphilus sp.]
MKAFSTIVTGQFYEVFQEPAASMSCSRIGFRFARGRRVLTWTSTLLFIFSASRLSVTQSAWPSIGPDGGDARAFAAVPGQPEHLYLGTVDSWIYESFDK